jgi:transcriptional regulator with XRE-family HTH domain
MRAMAHPSVLAQYVADRLAERHENPDEFARRIGINSSGLYKLLRGAYGAPSQRTLEKIAAGLGMSAAELLAAADPQTEVDPVEQAIRQRASEMREVLRDIPRPFWSPVVKSTFDRAIEGARDMAELFSHPPAEPPVRRPASGRLRRLKPALNGDSSAGGDGLAKVSHRLRAAAA